MTTRQRIQDRQQRLATHLCVGLDPDPALMPPALEIEDFCVAVMEATAPFACAFKPNVAFFEACGWQGWKALEVVCQAARGLDVPLILDAKRGDIGSTARRYAEAILGRLGADALTVSPYLGADAVTPFLEYNKDALSYVLCATSNPSGIEFQGSSDEGEVSESRSSDRLSARAEDAPSAGPLYLRVARMAAGLSRSFGNVGLVVGATRPEAMAAVRNAAPGPAWLVPGVGAQGGDLAAVAQQGPGDVVFNVSRGILYARTDGEFAAAAAAAAKGWRDAFNDRR